jgi:homoserine O-acetyltransferase
MWKYFTVLSCVLLTTPLARAGGVLQPTDGDVELHDFVLQSGQHMPTLRLHYTTLGTPHRDAAGHITNAALLLHGTTGTGKGFLAPTLADNLFMPGQPLDTTNIYVVLPDGIGAGGSTKPSDGLRGHFPHYGYVDQVEAQHAMLAAMGIDHVKVVLGISQGGMQAWLWGERFPDAMDALVPIASMTTPISGRNLIWRQIIIHAIRNDPDWHGGEYDPAHPPTQWMETAAPLFTMMIGNPDKLQAAGSDRAKTIAYYDTLITQYHSRDANDYLYDFESSADYDPAPQFAKIKAPLLAINFGDDAVNPPQLQATRQLIATMHGAKLVVLPGDDIGFGHASIFHAEIWGSELGKFLNY